MFVKSLFLFLSLFFMSLAVGAGAWRSQGEVRVEVRKFENDHVKYTVDAGQAVFARLEARHENAEGVEIVARGFTRSDKEDKQRNLMALEDAYARLNFGADKQWQILGGYQIFSWNATEAFYPADIINSRNFDSDLEAPEKLGELTLSLTRFIERGEVSFYVWPRYERPHYPGQNGRLGIGIDLEKLYFDDGDDNNDSWGPQYGLSIKRNFENFDLMLFGVHHINRNTIDGCLP